MSGLNTTWALAELDKFIGQTALSYPPRTPGVVDMTGRKVMAANSSEILESAPWWS